MASIKYIEDKNGNIVLPITSEKAVRDSNGTTLESKLQSLDPIDGEVIVGALPSSGVSGKIYRVPGTNTYTDYGWNGSQFIPLATYSGDFNADAYPLKLKGMARNGDQISTTTWVVGEVMYNTDTKLLRRCTAVSSGRATAFDTRPYVDGLLYLYNNDLYIYDGSGLSLLVQPLLKSGIEDLLQENFVYYTIDLSQAGSLGYMDVSGNFHSSAASKYIKIQCKRGQKFVFSGRHYSDSTIFAFNTVDTYPYNVISIGGGGSRDVTIPYIIPSDGYLFVGWLSIVAATLTRYSEYIDNNGNVLLGSPSIYLSPAVEDADLSSKTVADLYAEYDTLCSQYPLFIQRLDDLGVDESGTAIRQYQVKFAKQLLYQGEVSLSGYLDFDSLTNYWEDSYNNRTILINTGCHGSEKAPTWGTMLSVKELVQSTEPWALFIKSNFTLKIIPCLNPYGFTNTQRRNYNGVDLNRQNGVWSESEAIAWKAFIDSNLDAISYFDLHGTSGYYAYFETKSSDLKFGTYANACAKFTTAVQQNWAQYYNDNGAAYPYCFMCQSSYTGLLIEYTIEKGIAGVILETPQDFENGGSGAWGNRQKSCKLTKDMLINMMQSFGVLFRG